MKETGKRGFRVGSRNLIAVGHNSRVDLLQTNPNNLLTEVIKQKMDVLRAFGATLYVPDQLGQDQTATGAVYEALSMHAPLVSSARNIVDAFSKALYFAGQFVDTSITQESIDISLNSDLLDNALGPMGLTQVLQLWQANALTWEERREQLKVYRLTLYDAEVALQKIEEESLTPLGVDEQSGGIPDELNQEEEEDSESSSNP